MACTRDWWGRGSGRIWLDDVVCHGDEYSLEECAHKDWGVHDCSDDRVAGVICRDYDVNRVIQPKPRNESKKVFVLINSRFPNEILLSILAKRIMVLVKESK